MCKHPNVTLEIVITQHVAAAMTDIGAGGVVEAGIVQMSVRTHCDDCGSSGAYGAYAEDHPGAGATWPKWLRRRMGWLAVGNHLVREALGACHVPLIEADVLAVSGMRAPSSGIMGTRWAGGRGRQ